MESTNNDNTTIPICGFEGDQDVYGLGIRAGIYLQWFATVLVYNFLPEEVSSAEAINTGFQFSVLVALVYRTVTDSGIYGVEAYIMLMLCIGGLSWRRRTYAVRSTLQDLGNLIETGKPLASEMATPIGVASGFAVDLAILCYGLWYIYRGLDDMQQDPCFESTVFFFARLRLQGHFRHFVAAAFTIVSVVFCAILVVIIKFFILVIKDHRSILPLFENIYDVDGRLIRLRAEAGGELEHVWILSVIIPLDVIFFILSTELTISYNAIGGVDTVTNTGQLIPIVVGGSSLLVSFYEIWLKWRDDEFSECLFSPILRTNYLVSMDPRLHEVDQNTPLGKPPTFHYFPNLYHFSKWVVKRTAKKEHSPSTSPVAVANGGDMELAEQEP
jgi:hypothetical protein